MTALIYTRVSSDEQAKEGLSLPAQLKACRQYAAQRGWYIGGEHQDVLSGKRDDRTGYQRVLGEAKRLADEGRPVAVVVMRLDRLGRRLPERIRSREELKQAGVETHSVREGGLVSDMVAGFLAVLAEEEVERLGDRIRDTREHNEANGWHLPGRPPFGYRLRPATAEERQQGAPRSVLVVDEATAPIVREAFRRVAAGEATARGVTVWLTGVVTDRRLHHSWTRLMLKTATYCGRFESGERGRWQPIVDDATWAAVQARTVASGGRSGPVGGQHLLTGMLRCGVCGSRMAGWLVGRKYRRYRCSSFSQGAAGITRDCQSTVPHGPVDGAVVERVTALLAPLADADPRLRAALHKAWEGLRKPGDAVARERARAVARAARDVEDAKRRIADAARLLVDGTIDRTAYSALAAEEQRRLAAAEAALSAPELETPIASLPPLDEALRLLGGWPAVLSGEPIPEQRRVLSVLIERVVPIRTGRGRYDVQITWRPLGAALASVAGRTA
jgi:site-specific DNA recombinase